MSEDERSAMRAYVLHPELKVAGSKRSSEPALAEAVALGDALPDLDVVGAEIVRLPKLHPGMLFGKGKIAELKQRIHDAEAGLVLIDGPVSPVQQRNLEKEWGVKLLDRTGLILEIFSDRARTKEGVLQVEMAALTYQRTRLVRAWTHLERQRGGLGFVGGPGETQIEADRRAIDTQLNRLRAQLAKVQKTRALHRAGRAKVPYPTVALVGYTNAGKSTLFNKMTGADVFVKDMLFATLDPTMRKIEFPTGETVIFSDTVGFVSDLPTELVAAFRATLEEVLEADVILHVRDISHPQSQDQWAEVVTILGVLGVSKDTPQIEVWNKIDNLPADEAEAQRIIAKRTGKYVTSAITGEGVTELLDHVLAEVTDPKTHEMLQIGWDDAASHAFLHQMGVVDDSRENAEGWQVDVTWSRRDRDRFHKKRRDRR
ncbi:GTPase HflX [Octadecabacter sp. SW4]|uniref:GTPase HflX n=1 Tax=Octadecabacter sp. SW4 TaxID=2602067 RepID=UPI0011C1F8D0|nr:GTPase HflX [Octadecabacter sp. SW4]QEE35594.1 GTPase HflX [Octadecabacter sp. SW4]